jgi:hypothetical protein
MPNDDGFLSKHVALENRNTIGMSAGTVCAYVKVIIVKRKKIRLCTAVGERRNAH